MSTRNLFYLAGRISGYKCERRHIFGHYTSGADNCSFSDCYSRKNHYIGGNPYIIFNPNSSGTHDPFVAFMWIKRMNDCANSDIRADKHIISDDYLRFVKNGQIKIAYKILSDMDIESEIAAERGMKNELFSNGTKQTA